jgi:outer membrane lipoprotein carrier protein
MRHCLWIALLLAPLVFADTTLQQRLEPIHSLAGDFSQRVLAEDGTELERSSGEFKLLQPGYFSWHIQKPDEQLLLATGSTLLHYDVELETATQRELGDADGRGPLAILSGDEAELTRLYTIEQISDDSYRLLPRNTRGDVVELILSFEKGLPHKISVNDRLRQTTVIRFDAVQLNPALVAEDFHFEPPEGVDLYFNER